MLVKAIETFKKLSGEVVKQGDVLDLPPEKVSGLIERGRVRPIPPTGEPETASPDIPSCPDQAPGQATQSGGGETGLKTADPGQFDTVAWDSPLFGRLEAPVMEQGPENFTLRHPLTGEVVTLPNEWLVSMDERAAILEFDGNLPREEADSQAKTEFFGMFGKRRPA